MALRIASGIVLLACLVPTLLGVQAAASIVARGTIPNDSYFVGQEIPLLIQVRTSGEEVTIPTPTIRGAEVYPAETDSENTPAGPDQGFRFRIVAREPGRLIIPALRVVSREQTTRTAPILLTIRSVPLAGRSAAFLGGVGALKIEAEAVPSRLRLGETLEYRLRLQGPGVLGSLSPPRLSGIGEEAVRIESIPTQTDFAASPPVQTFRWRLRPSQPGSLVIPPQRVASYDPSSGSYQTRASTSVAIQVEDVPELDPAAIEFGPESVTESRGPDRSAWPLALGLAIGAVLGSAGALWWFRRRSSQRDPRRNPRITAARLARELSAWSGRADPLEAARRVAESLAEYLEASQERPPGALTPAEARDGFADTTADAKLAEQARRLIERSDWVRFGMLPTEDSANTEAEGLLQDAADLFTRLAGRSRRYVGPLKKPREAPDGMTA